MNITTSALTEAQESQLPLSHIHLFIISIMPSPAHLLFALAAHAVADSLSIYLGDNCSNSNLGTATPVELGTCYELGQAQSYILEKDVGSVYNLYSGGACNQYQGQVSVSNICHKVGKEITGIINIGKQDRRSMIRGATRDVPTPGQSRNVNLATKRLEGESYQCPNIHSGAYYFFVVEHSSAVQESLFEDEENMIRNAYMAAFNSAYQNPSGQTSVRANVPEIEGTNLADPLVSLEMSSGVIQDFQLQDMQNLTDDLLTFRDMQGSPVDFTVSIYSGRLDTNDVGGLLGTFVFRAGR
ncbi:hypothetical protein DE146DRAFT_8808 [Phaeosphaeria sp. MPI-PUGE-AT-0046c]|nr:hypothetical protein DE146DRAFT_8808 [Phaeosphaeria sp. MPI-PUGE-AT-0046c]